MTDGDENATSLNLKGISNLKKDDENEDENASSLFLKDKSKTRINIDFQSQQTAAEMESKANKVIKTNEVLQ